MTTARSAEGGLLGSSVPLTPGHTGSPSGVGTAPLASERHPTWERRPYAYCPAVAL